MRLSANGIKLIHNAEGCVLHPYLDSGGVPTIGWGSTRYEDGGAVTMADPPISQSRADALFANRVIQYIDAVDHAVIVPLTQNQTDALISLCYNIGMRAFQTSTLVKLLNKKDYAGAAKEFPRWDKDNGKSVDGLHRRRIREMNLFLSNQ